MDRRRLRTCRYIRILSTRFTSTVLLAHAYCTRCEREKTSHPNQNRGNIRFAIANQLSQKGGRFEMSIPKPHRNAELYRGHSAPSRLTHSDFIAIAPDGTTMVGKSDLTGRVWNGVVRVVNNPDDLTVDFEKKPSYPDIILNNGVSDGCFLGDSSKLIVADDMGELSIWNKQASWSGVTKTNEQEEAWVLNCNVCEHDDGVLAVDVSAQGDKIVSGGLDNCIKVWDLSLVPLEAFCPAHKFIISDIKCNKKSDNFLSSGLDGAVALWDIKAPKTQVTVLVNMDCAARAVCWISETKFLAGFDSGAIELYDISKPNSVISRIDIDCPVHRIIYNESINTVAICSDTRKLRVYKMSNNYQFELLYEDIRHTENIRGMAWGNEESSDLYTCGWDGKVHKHSIQHY